jgi:hypothetical protein
MDLLGPIEAEAQLELVFDKQSGQFIAHEGPVGLNPVFERKLGILGLKAEDGAKKIDARQQGLTAMPVYLNDLGERINGQIMGDDPVQNRFNRGEADNTPGMLLEAILTRQVAVPSYLDLGHHRLMFFPIWTVWLYRGEIFRHGNEKESEELDLFSVLERQRPGDLPDQNTEL